MHIFHGMVVWVVVTCCGVVSAAAKGREDQPFERGFFSGAGVARYAYSLTENDLNTAEWVVDNPDDTHVEKDKSTGYFVFAGWHLHRYIGIEVSYADLGELTYRLGGRLEYQQLPTNVSCVGSPRCLPPAHLGPTQFSYRSRLLTLGVQGTYPILRRWSVRGRTGPGIRFLRISDNLASHAVQDSAWYASVGGSYAFTPQLRINLDGQMIDSPVFQGGSGAGETRDGIQAGAIANAGWIRSLLLGMEYRW